MMMIIHNKDEDRNFSHLNEDERTDFLRQKAIHDYNNKNSIHENSSS